MTDEFDKSYWEQRWHGAASMYSHPAHPALAREIDDLIPGRALEVGCGAGAEALWLAERGWRVSGVDLASSALAIARRREEDAPTAPAISWVQADVTTWAPDEPFELVTTFYAHAETSQVELYERLAGWVAPGGTLLIVGHLRGAHHVDHAAATAAEIVGLLPTEQWKIVTAEEGGADVVVRAVRRDPEDDATVEDPRERRGILFAVCIALMAVIASVTGLNVAQPDLAVEFSASQGQVLWFINIYTVALAALLLPLGAAGDRWGRRPMLMAGLGLFGAANVAAGLAGSSEVLLVARLLAGVGAAMIMPVTLAVITATFPEGERSKAIGVWTAVAGGGGILGMFLSALLVDVASWRWLFALPVVLVAVALATTMRSVPNSRRSSTGRFDVAGSLLSVVAVLGLVLVLHEGPERGWADTLTLGSLAFAVAGFVGFVSWEPRRAAPLLDVRLFRDRRMATGSLTLLVVFGVQAGIFVVLFPFLQAVLSWSGLRATAALMPMAALMMVAAGLAPHVAGRAGARVTMAVGIGLGAVGLALMALFVSVDGGYLAVLPGMLAMGLGMGLSMTPATEAITGSLPRADQGVASALNDVTRELGTALGIALLGAVLSAGYRNAIDDRLVDLQDRAAEPAREGVATALAAADAAGSQRDALVVAAQESFVAGWQQAMWSGVAVMGALLIYVLTWRGVRQGTTGRAARRRSASDDDRGQDPSATKPADRPRAGARRP